MRIALITNLMHDQLGLFYISAVLKRAGHDVRYFFDDRNLERELKKFSPDLAGFSVLTGNHLWALKCALAVKEILPKVKTIIGGPHATYYPEIINHPGIDIICRGEGENSIIELCNALEKDNNFYNIRGMWVKDGNIIHRNDFAQLIDNLDSLPFPDRSIYDLYRFFTLHHFYPFLLSSRGCPFDCTFCFEPIQREYVKGKGKYIRFRSPLNVIQEAVEIKEQYRVRSFEFVDDIFGIKKEWLREFSELWKKVVKLPFHCNLRTDIVDDEVILLLKEAGCISVAFGIESGSNRVRNQIFGKSLDEDSIIRVANLLRKNKIRVVTYNILGAPGETYEEVWQTLYLNQKVKADYASVSLMQPYPGTGIHRFAVEKGYLKSENSVDINKFPFSFHDVLPVETPYRKRLINLQKLFNLALWFPGLTPLVRQLVKLPVYPLYYLIFIITHTFGFWFRIKKVPLLFLLNLVFNAGKVFMVQKSAIKHQAST